MWTVSVVSPQVPSPDLAAYRWYRDGVLAGQSPATQDPVPFTYQIAADGAYQLTVSAVDGAGNESAQSPPTPVVLDRLAPTIPGAPQIIAVAWVA